MFVFFFDVLKQVIQVKTQVSRHFHLFRYNKKLKKMAENKVFMVSLTSSNPDILKVEMLIN